MTETVFANARLVLEDEVREGHLVVRDGLIAAPKKKPLVDRRAPRPASPAPAQNKSDQGL